MLSYISVTITESHAKTLKCYLGGVSSQISDLAIFDVSRKIIPGYSACKYLCERHFDPSDLIEYVDGKKQ